MPSLPHLRMKDLCIVILKVVDFGIINVVLYNYSIFRFIDDDYNVFNDW